MEPKAIVMHGFTEEEALEVMRAVKKTVADPSAIAFAMTTEHNMKWPLEKLVSELKEEWTWFKTHNPDGSPKTQAP